jgi:DNA repair protein RecN (Recombination protein N)
LGEGDENTIAALTLARQLLNSVSKYNQACSKLAERIQASQIEIKDIYQELESLNHELVFNPKELDLLNEKIDLKNRLLKKHGVNAVEELLSIRNSIEQKLLDFNAIETNSKDLEKEIDTLTKVCKKQAASISEKRKKGISSIEKHIDAQLSELSMPNAHFKIDLSPSKELSVNGQDEVAFLFSANKGSNFKELQKVASGGELSRLMLCLKALTAEKKALPTIIFDEIDTGISGDVANKMGNIFEKMAIKMQVISITHLAQIASKGKHHLFVYKNNEKEQTRSFIKHLSQDERVVEIAKMLSTGKPTESAIKNAKDLLNQN